MDLVVAASGTGYRARFGARDWRCAVGRGGIARKTGEGDGISPLGCWSLRRLLYRPDRFEDLPVTALPRAPLDPQDGWCDAPDHGDYNRPVRLPFAGRHEVLWRDDALYDLIVVLGHNDDPVVPGQAARFFCMSRIRATARPRDAQPCRDPICWSSCRWPTGRRASASRADTRARGPRAHGFASGNGLIAFGQQVDARDRRAAPELGNVR